jgi:hypothetical protein
MCMGAPVHPSQCHRRAERRKCGFCYHQDAPLCWFLIEHQTIKRFALVRLPTAAAVLRSAAGCQRNKCREMATSVGNTNLHVARTEGGNHAE